MTTSPIVNVNPDPFEELRTAEELNKVQKAQGLPPLPYVFEIKGEPQRNVEDLVERLGEALRDARNPGIPRWTEGEGVVRVPAATFNSAEATEKVLNKQIQAAEPLLVLDDLARSPPTVPALPL